MRIRTVSLLMAAAVLGLVLSGCGTSAQQAETLDDSAVRPGPPAALPVSEISSATPAVDLLDLRERELARREAALGHRMSELEGLAADLRQRERDVHSREQIAEPAPAPSEPVLPTVLSSRQASATLPAVLEEPVRERAEPLYRTVNLTLPASTELEIELLDGLSSETSTIGDLVVGRVTHDVYWRGYVAVPAGSRVEGTVVDVNPQKKIGGQARLAVHFDRMAFASGDSVPVQARLELAGTKQVKKDAATIGGATAGGAVLGRILGGDKSKGTAIGAVVGAAVGTTVAYKNGGDPVSLEPGQIVRLPLDGPVHVAVTEPSGPATVALR